MELKTKIKLHEDNESLWETKEEKTLFEKISKSFDITTEPQKEDYNETN